MRFYGVMSSSVEGRQALEAITAEQFNEAAIASGRTMAELADLLGVSRGMVHAYRNQGVSSPPRRVQQVRQIMGMWLRDETGNTFGGYTDEDLIREVRRRLLRVQELLSETNRADGTEVDRKQGASSPGDGGGRFTGSGGPA